MGLRCCTRTFSSCNGVGGYSSLRCAGFHCGGFSCCGAQTLGTWASAVAARGPSSCGTQALGHVGFSSCGSRALEHRISSCGTWALLLRGMWDLPRPRIEPVSPALASGFLTTAPPGKYQLFKIKVYLGVPWWPSG